MKDIGLFRYFLVHTLEILKRFKMLDCNLISTPMVPDLKLTRNEDTKLVDPTLYQYMIESPIYLVNTKPDICFVLNTLRQSIVEPKKSHWRDAKHVLRYIEETIHYAMQYTGNGYCFLHGFVDSD